MFVAVRGVGTLGIAWPLLVGDKGEEGGGPGVPLDLALFAAKDGTQPSLDKHITLSERSQQAPNRRQEPRV